MANSNKKPGQGKTPQQYKDSSRFAWYSVIGMIIILFLASLLSGCSCSHKTHVITEWDGDREIRWYTCTPPKPGDVSSNIKWEGLEPIFKK